MCFTEDGAKKSCGKHRGLTPRDAFAAKSDFVRDFAATAMGVPAAALAPIEIKKPDRALGRGIGFDDIGSY